MRVNPVTKKTLANGMTILVVSQHHIPKVSLQLWYDVGSKDELSGQRGLAHLIEHMIFKGTNTLSESDINLIVHKLSGHCNAFTSQDYTGYLFDLPSHYWKHALAIMADCMVNCTFRQELLNSEMKAVIQELKMYEDDYSSTLIESLVTSIFPDHPYHYPIIGYKHDLWSLNREKLLAFYKHHYIPNNATLVVVGDVNAHEIFEEAEKLFGSIPANPDYCRQMYHHDFDIASQSITLYRDIKKPFGMFAWVVPGARSGTDSTLDILSWIVGGGAGSRLTHLLIDKYKLATQFETFVYDLFDYGLFIIAYEPTELKNVAEIKKIVHRELESIATKGVSDIEMLRAKKKTEMDVLSLAENNQKYAYLLGKYYLATRNENYFSDYITKVEGCDIVEIQELIQQYLRPAPMHEGIIVPLPESEKPFWSAIQEMSDKEDFEVLSQIVRQEDVEPGCHVHTIVPEEAKEFIFPQPETIVLSNGVKVLFYNNPVVEKIDVILELKTRNYYDPEDKLGLNLFLMDMLQEGTQQKSKYEFDQTLESHGMSLFVYPGQISLTMLSDTARVGFQLLAEMLMQPAFPKESLETVRTKILSDIVEFWDTPVQFTGQIVRSHIYGKHPYAKPLLGSLESIKSITLDDIYQAYKRFITPDEAHIAVVGNLDGIHLKDLLETTLGKWKGEPLEDLLYPSIVPVQDEIIEHYMNRDQMVLAFGGLSVKRLDPDYEKLLLFDQVLTGGVLGSMSSRLFDLRERSGLFYTIGGSLVVGCYKEPGIQYIKTLVSRDRLQEAQKAITNVLNDGANGLNENELHEAKAAVKSGLIDNFTTNKSMAVTFLFLDTFNLPRDYFNKRLKTLQQFTVDEVKKTVDKHLSTQAMIKVIIGRI